MRKGFDRRKQIVVLAGIFLAFLLVLLFVFDAWVRAAVIVPIQYALWFGSLVLHSIDQKILWPALFLAAAGAVLTLLAQSPRSGQEELPQVSLYGQGRVGYWISNVRMMLTGVYTWEYFSAEIKKLILALLAEREHSTARDIERRIKSGAMPVPAGLEAIFDQNRTGWDESTSGFRRTLRRLLHPGAPVDPQRERMLEAILKFLEEQPEVHE